MNTDRGLEQLATLNGKTIDTAHRLHAAGLSWGAIGEQVGMTAQAASRRFGQTGTLDGQQAKTAGRITGTRRR